MAAFIDAIRPFLTSERRARGAWLRGADRELGLARPTAGGLPRSGARRPTLPRLPLARYSSRDWLEPIDGGPGAGATRSLELAVAHVHYGRKGRTSAQRRIRRPRIRFGGALEAWFSRRILVCLCSGTGLKLSPTQRPYAIQGGFTAPATVSSKSFARDDRCCPLDGQDSSTHILQQPTLDST